MPITFKLLLAVQVISALAIIVLVLLQQGKGADMGSAFGSGSAGSLFGATGAANFLSRATKWAAVVFFASTAGLAYFSHQGSAAPGVDSGVMQSYPADRSVPQVPGSSAPASSVPGAASVPAAPAKPDASVPSVPAAPATPAPAAPAPAAGDKPAETPAK
ncbi:preprotein translocase subunit SecG [Achromobacter sp. HZ01]|jgi:preprotein translocase subunit SecG|uniref:Protein-export membrane protein SecG n=1 Tax=Achromobacter pulmonis TaxID=1389932 RepID=A0A2N8KF43_9BURK|nr:MULTISPECIES: preprotein translocase subunit SecG [Achromobacter]MBO9328764.1 preprotein translocase subunit SecG [Achromobacter xylosoxidans]PND32066.1 preprotein translocase subunit SecG [Achromobacter pulmonis]RAP61990.1 preprotein translocase subunit SecG [Achromobacter sp. HZ01]